MCNARICVLNFARSKQTHNPELFNFHSKPVLR